MRNRNIKPGIHLKIQTTTVISSLTTQPLIPHKKLTGPLRTKTEVGTKNLKERSRSRSRSIDTKEKKDIIGNTVQGKTSPKKLIRKKKSITLVKELAQRFECTSLQHKKTEEKETLDTSDKHTRRVKTKKGSVGTLKLKRKGPIIELSRPSLRCKKETKSKLNELFTKPHIKRNVTSMKQRDSVKEEKKIIRIERRAGLPQSNLLQGTSTVRPKDTKSYIVSPINKYNKINKPKQTTQFKKLENKKPIELSGYKRIKIREAKALNTKRRKSVKYSSQNKAMVAKCSHKRTKTATNKIKEMAINSPVTITPAATLEGTSQRRVISKCQSQPQLEINSPCVKEISDFKAKQVDIESSTTKIQAVFRGYLTRRVLKLNRILARDYFRKPKVLIKKPVKELTANLTDKLNKQQKTFNSIAINTEAVPEVSANKNTEKELRNSKKNTLSIETNPIETIYTASKNSKEIPFNLKQIEVKPTLVNNPPTNRKHFYNSNEVEKSEKAQNDSLDLLIEKEMNLLKNKSIFERDSFQDFALNKFGDKLNTGNISKLLKTRERAMQYRENTEKKYLNKMLKSNHYSPRTYYSKRKELERWVNKEKEEIQKTRIGIIDDIKTTIRMIEDAHQGAINIKKLLINKGVNDSNYTVSLPLDVCNELEEVKSLDQRSFNRHSVGAPFTLCTDQDESSIKEVKGKKVNDVAEFVEVLDKPLTNNNKKKGLSSHKSDILDSKKDIVEVVDNRDKEVHLDVNSKDKESKYMLTEIKKDKDKTQELVTAPQEIIEIIPASFKSSTEAEPKIPNVDIAKDNPPLPESKPQEEIKTVNTEVIGNLFTSLFGQVPADNEEIAVNAPHIQEFLKALVLSKKQGIDTSIYQINKYLDELFNEVITTQGNQLITFINQPVMEDPLEVLKQLQSSERVTQETVPILSLETYLELENKREGAKVDDEELQEFIEECEHIHNKAIFDAVNETLDCMRPYAIKGHSLPWMRTFSSKFSSLPSIIKNVKEQVLSWAKVEAGTLPQLEFIVNNRFDEGQFLEKREKKEKRLVSLLAQEIKESENKWLNYELEITEVEIDISDMVIDYLVNEIVDILTNAT